MRSEHPTLSVGMPVFNGDRFIEEALDSILSQSFEDFELIISDNASTDRTAEICQTYATRDERIAYHRQAKNIGVIENFNTAFRLSSGKYFKWAATDDACGPDYFKRAVDVLDSDPSVVLVWAKTVGIDENGQRVPLTNEISDLNSPTSVYSPDPLVRFRRLLRNIWWADGPLYGMIRSSALKATKWLHPPHHSGDQILLAELSLMGRFFEIPDALFFSRVHAGKTSSVYRSLRDRAALVDRRNPGEGLVGTWRALSAYPQRISMYVLVIARAQVGILTKCACVWEVIRAILSWAVLRSRQVLAGRSPWS